MRRRPLILAIATALTPVVCTLSAAPAQASGSTLTVTTIGRNGAKIANNVVNLIDTRTSVTYQGKSGSRISLPAGSYVLTTDIETPDSSPAVMGMTDTLAARTVSVSGSTAVTLDARQGKQVTVSLDAMSGTGATGYSAFLDAAVCGSGTTFGQSQAYNRPGGLYEIPNSSSAVTFAWMQSWQNSDTVTGPNGTAYYLSGHTTGLPASPSAAFHRSGLAHVPITVRGGEATDSNTATMFQPEPPGQLTCATDLAGQSFQAEAPYNVNAYVSPGTWIARTDQIGNTGETGGGFTRPRAYSAGQTVYQTFGRAVFGPTAGLPVVRNRAITYTPYNTIADATGGTDEFARTRDTVSLLKGGKVLKQATVTADGGSFGTFSQGITTAGWYTLRVAATRATPASLSTTVGLVWTFWANPARSQVSPGYLTELNPLGLNRFNSAAPNSTTQVDIGLRRMDVAGGDPAYAAETVRTVRVYASHDNGGTWSAVPVHASGSSWVADVPEPATSGLVALRTVVTDTAGDTSQQSVYRAYRVG